MNREVLTRPFPADQVRQRPGQHGKVLSYADISSVIARLNEGCDSWSFEIVRHDLHDSEVLVVGKLTADGVVKMAFGGSQVTIDKNGQVVSLADDYKAAASDALKKAASLLGVGLELYGGSAQQPEPPRQQRARPSPDLRVTARQLAALHAAVRRRGLPPQSVTSLVEDATGKVDLTQLSRAEASGLLDQLNGQNGDPR